MATKTINGVTKEEIDRHILRLFQWSGLDPNNKVNIRIVSQIVMIQVRAAQPDANSYITRSLEYIRNNKRK